MHRLYLPSAAALPEELDEPDDPAAADELEAVEELEELDELDELDEPVPIEARLEICETSASSFLVSSGYGRRCVGAEIACGCPSCEYASVNVIPSDVTPPSSLEILPLSGSVSWISSLRSVLSSLPVQMSTLVLWSSPAILAALAGEMLVGSLPIPLTPAPDALESRREVAEQLLDVDARADVRGLDARDRLGADDRRAGQPGQRVDPEPRDPAHPRAGRRARAAEPREAGLQLVEVDAGSPYPAPQRHEARRTGGDHAERAVLAERVIATVKSDEGSVPEPWL